MASKEKVTFKNDEDDFGFSFHNADEMKIEITNKKAFQDNVYLRSQLEDYKKRLDKVMTLVVDFMNKLKSDPGKTVIKWPNRTTEVEVFLKKITSISEGNSLDKE